MKRTIAIAAAVMTLLASGCGNIEEEKSTTMNAVADAASSSESEESSEEENSSLSESSETESGEEDEEYKKVENIESYKGEYINDDNCFILNPEKNPEADRDTLYHAAELAIKQYNCIAKHDKQGFFDNMDIKHLLQSKYAAKFYAGEYIEEPTERIFGSIDSYLVTLYGKELNDIYEKYNENSREENTGHAEDDMIAALDSLMKKAADNVSIDNADIILNGEEGSDDKCFNIKRLCHKYKSIDESEFFSQPEKFVLAPSEDTKYIINYDYYNPHFDGGAIFRIDMIVLEGGHAYHLDDCDIWLEGDKSSVMPFYVSITENRWEGLSAKEAGEKIYDEYYGDEARFADEMYEEVWAMLCPDGWDDCPDEESPQPPTWDDIIASGDFAQAVSENGLDLSADSSEAYGDHLLCDLYLDDEGTVYMIHDPDDESPFFIRYVSPDGKIGECHYEDHHRL